MTDVRINREEYQDLLERERDLERQLREVRMEKARWWAFHNHQLAVEMEAAADD